MPPIQFPDKLILMELEELRKKRDGFITRIFWLGFEIALIFGIPAALGAIAGTKLDKIYNTGNKIVSFILMGTFIFSWIIVICKYKKISSEIDKIENKIKILKEKAQKNNQPK